MSGDLDGDGDIDAVIGTFGGRLRVITNDGTGRFSEVSRGPENGSGNSAQGLELGDDDGDLDLVVVNGEFSATSDRLARLWLNDGAGNFSLGMMFPDSVPTTSVKAGDLDGDGDLDAVVGNDGEANVLWLNDGNGMFTAAAGNVGFGSTRSVAIVDPNGDGVPDLWVGNGVNRPEEDWVYLNDGVGVFTRGQTIEARTSPALAVADFTGNGTSDLLLASAEGDHGLWGIPDEVDLLAAFLEGFGISGENDDPGDDADGDGLLNFEELAFNLDPSVADAGVFSSGAAAVRGRPFLSVVEQGGVNWIEARVVRRRGAGRLDYALTVGSDLENFVEPAGVVVTTEVIDENYERALYRYEIPAGKGRQFGRVEVRYE